MQGDRQVHKHTQLPLPVMLTSDVDEVWLPSEPAVTSHTPASERERERGTVKERERELQTDIGFVLLQPEIVNIA